MHYDIIIKNGRIIDGTGNPYYFSDVGVNNGKISMIRTHIDDDGEKLIDATGLIICPGFIDTHSHTDWALPFSNSTESFIRQGITTCVTGMCGLSVAPVHPEKEEEIKQSLSRFNTLFNTLEFTWNTFNEYLNFLEKNLTPINLACFVGYESVRIAGGPVFENRSSNLAELERMNGYITEAMEAGAFGMSTGLIYAPQVYATTKELIELMKEVAKYNGYYFSHVRGEGKSVVKAINELVEIVEKSNCQGGHVSHHKIAGKENWGRSKDTLSIIEQANERRGVSITCDSYPYKRGLSTLIVVLPSWTREGGVEKAIERIKDPDIQERVKTDILETDEGLDNWVRYSGFENIYISSTYTGKFKQFEGKSISEITSLTGRVDDWETFFDILIDEEGRVTVTAESMAEEDIRNILTSRFQMVGTDGAGIPCIPELGTFHPRYYGTYPRIIRKYVQEEKILNLEDAIRRMTSYPAQRLGLRDRGLIHEDNWADIVIFDPNNITDKATYENPHQLAEGIPYVIVNGKIVVVNSQQQDVFPGVVLRHQSN
ncbi:MAG: N-acyl-D-amino-acid deacylase family protein [Candidatus Hodarchaeales archaeon]